MPEPAGAGGLGVEEEGVAAPVKPGWVQVGRGIQQGILTVEAAGCDAQQVPPKVRGGQAQGAEALEAAATLGYAAALVAAALVT